MSTHTTTTSGWQLTDNAAEAYETHLVPVIFRGLAERLVAAAHVGPGDRVLDVACGTGVVARAAARRMDGQGSVVGLDVNADMLATARAATRGVRPTIDLHEGDVAHLPFEDDLFDAVLCQEAVQFFPDRVGALREMRRVATPGGRITFSVLRSLERHPVYDIFAAALDDHAGADAAAMMRSPFALGDAETLRAYARDAGLQDVTIQVSVGTERFPSVPEFVRWEAASSPLAMELDRLGRDEQAALVDRLERELAPYLDDVGLVFHNETHIVTARAG